MLDSITMIDLSKMICNAIVTDNICRQAQKMPNKQRMKILLTHTQIETAHTQSESRIDTQRFYQLSLTVHLHACTEPISAATRLWACKRRAGAIDPRSEGAGLQRKGGRVQRVAQTEVCPHCKAWGPMLPKLSQKFNAFTDVLFSIQA